MVVIHHLVVDGVSWRILLEDFSVAYEQIRADKPVVLPPKSSSFQQWSRSLAAFARSKTLRKELEFWRRDSDSDGADLPKDRLIRTEDRQVRLVQERRFTLDEGATGLLLKKANWAYNTEINDLLLTALGISLREQWGLSKARVELEGHGREEIVSDVDVKRTVGWFTCQFPVTLHLGDANEVGESIVETKEFLRRIPNKGIGYGILRYMGGDGTLGSFPGDPEISFNYLGQVRRRPPAGKTILSDLEVGDPINPEMATVHSLDITGVVVDDELTIAIRYLPGEYLTETIARFADRFQNSLRKIISHCCAKEKQESTLSDYVQSDMEEDEIEGLSNLIREVGAS
jgi:non-ribosomal peptide synthase protein (TIGR01720 family)